MSQLRSVDCVTRVCVHICRPYAPRRRETLPTLPMRLPLLLAAPAVALLLHTTACQRSVAVTTPTDAPQTGLAGSSVSTPFPTSTNTVEPSPQAAPADFDEKKRPQWLQARIEEHLKEKKQNPPIQIMSYQYKGNTVYFESAPCCDQFTTLYDASGKVLCHPDGGLTGRGDGNCADFAKTRTEERLVWQDPR
ncbi:hypothetical protein SAMN06269173_103157 [Hymenobacter mucosus]|uniref:DUF6970 domain-containing protein n=2 Tax=Hymenobacter mucosus TaxID=1411120 RepID=A0A238WVL0_9BACT|nr:hypothetical protein SAMN06269173_103157 [Hymenobacter mucosus]